MNIIMALMELTRGKILSREAYNHSYAAMYVIDGNIFVDCDDDDFDQDQPLPFLDEESLYMNDWVYGNLLQ